MYSRTIPSLCLGTLVPRQKCNKPYVTCYQTGYQYRPSVTSNYCLLEYLLIGISLRSSIVPGSWQSYVGTELLSTGALLPSFSSSPEIPPNAHHPSEEDGETEEGCIQQQQQQFTSDAELKRLRDLLKQRDDEISITQSLVQGAFLTKVPSTLQLA